MRFLAGSRFNEYGSETLSFRVADLYQDLKNNHVFVQELWGGDYSAVFTATMSNERFRFLLSHLRLDDVRVRAAAKKKDKFAPAR